MYFLDRSNVLWLFRNEKLTKLFEIDMITTIYDENRIGVLIEGEPYQLCQDKKDRGENHITRYAKYEGRASLGEMLYYCLYKCTTEIGSYVIEFFDLWGSYRIIRVDIDPDIYAIFNTSVEYDGNHINIRISYVAKIGGSELVINHIDYSDSRQDNAITRSETRKIIGSRYEYVACAHIETDKTVYSLLDMSQYDSIFPNLFESILRRGDDYYIRDTRITDQIEEFDFGTWNIKSARGYAEPRTAGSV